MDKVREARRLRDRGRSYREIGRRLGVSHVTAAKMCDPGYRERQNANTRRWLEAHG